MPDRREPVYMAVPPDEDVDEIIARLRPILPAEVHLHIPANATAFQDFEDFRKLKGLMAAPGTSIVVAAEDKTIERLAHLLGFPVERYEPRSRDRTASAPEPAPRPPDRPSQPSPRAPAWASRAPILLSLASALVVLAILAFLAVPAITTAEVVVTARSETLAQDVHLVLVPEGSEAPGSVTIGDRTVKPIPVPAKAVETATELAAEGVAHGSKTVPDRPASGRVRLSNPNPFPVTVKAGTAVATVNGVRYVTTADVTVPAADPFGSGVLGTSEVGVTATSGGSATNLDARAIQSRLDNGVYVINLEPISGGTDRKVPVVSAEDLKAVRDDLEGKLRAQLLDALSNTVPSGYRLVTETVELSQVQVESDQEEGAVAERFTVKVRASASGLVYRPEDLREAALSSARSAVMSRRLGEATPAVTDVITSPFQLLSVDPAVVFGTKVVVRYRYQLDEAGSANLRQRLAGKPMPEAEALLASLPYVSSANITKSPAWMPGGLPGSPDRITLRFQESQ